MGSFAGFLFRQLTSKPKPLAASVRLEGQTALITGANAGLGLDASKELAAHGLKRLIITARDATKGQAAKEAILKATPGVEVEVWSLDYDSFQSITDFGKRIAAVDRLDIAILNAGVKFVDRVMSKTGHEAHIQVNHLGTALVSTYVLQPLDRTSKSVGKPARLTIVSSENHFWAKFREQSAPNILEALDANEDCFQGKDKSNIERYSTSKLLNVFWMRELNARAAKLELDIIINTVNPGFCDSSLHRSDESARSFVKLIAWTSAQGASVITDAATRHATDRGAYLSEQQVKKASPFVLSQKGADLQRKLWKETVAVLRSQAAPAEMLETLDKQ
ncbi:Short-chain dehydrogenase reductase SDR [Cordyceps militaris]|uniref:Short-chain dehydrogenase reductase SDR n=1 Tax=Cordyceps militaris TaxID=73501 RepID=A0A2H4S9Q9_CORMI|nr:Short-chain dehydrogenase reductase SDR [Cordyceps militaris]